MPVALDCAGDDLGKHTVTARCVVSSVALGVRKALLPFSAEPVRRLHVSVRTLAQRPALPGQNERLDEENRVRLKEETRQARLREKRREEAKNNIILQV